MQKLNAIEYTMELKKILSYSPDVGFFFGAGTSCAFGLPGIMELTDNVYACLSSAQKALFDDTKKLIEASSGLDSDKITVENILNELRQIKAITACKNTLSFGKITGKQAQELDQVICRSIFKGFI